MPKWGLTERQRASRPWGLPAALLQPAKTITDPVHGDVYITELERLVLDSPPMQRLRRVRQLGTTHLVYPAATHSRLSHALGTLRAAQDLLDAVVDGLAVRGHGTGLLDEWAAAGDEAPRTLPDGTVVQATELDRKVAEATVLARLGGLLHDLCHVPYGHTVEDDLRVLVPHDANDARFRRLWAGLDPRARDAVEAASGNLSGELKMLIISKTGEDPADSSTYPFVADIVGNTICADLMDYLRRDHLMTGLPMSLGHRFMNNFYVMGSKHPHFASRMVVRIARNGVLRTDVVTELEKYLRFRYELTERVLTHHAKGAADAMMGKLLEMWHDQQWLDLATIRHPDVVASTGRTDVDAVQKALAAALPEPVVPPPGASPPPPGAPLVETNAAVAALHDEVQHSLDCEFTRRSDDGLLEHLQDLAGAAGAETRLRAVGALATAVQDRVLYKMIGRSGTDAVSLAALKHKKFGSASARRRLEREAAAFSGLTDGWKVVLWLPSPGMRLKVADVLADDGQQVNRLAELSPQGGQIVEQHRKLWAVSVYASRDAVTDSGDSPDNGDSRTADALLAHLRDALDIPLTRWDGLPVRGKADLVLDRVSDIARLSRDETRSLRDDYTVAAKTEPGTDTYDNLLRETWKIACLVKPSLERKPPRSL